MPAPVMHAPTPIHPPEARYYVDDTSDTGLQTFPKAEPKAPASRAATASKRVIGSHPVTGAKTLSTPTAQAQKPARASYGASLAIMSSTSSKSKRTGKPRAPRPKKRHLVRWTDDMDKKLLLTIQQECNKQNITLPWKEIGETMGPLISGGAVVQHLSKLRIRMVAQNLPVPPPLKRGGGTKISTAPSLPRRPRKTSNPNTTRDTTVKKSSKPVSKKRAITDMISDESEEEDFKTDSDSDADFGKPFAKRTRTAANVKRESPPLKLNETDSSGDSSDDDAEYGEDVDGNRIVAAGARFLELEDDVPMQKPSPSLRGAKAKKPSKIVTLKPSKTIIKREASQDQQSLSDKSDKSEDEAAEGSEELADRAAHTLEAISHTATPPVTDFAGNTSTYPGTVRVSDFGSYAINGNAVSNAAYHSSAGNGHSAYGGLPSAASLNGSSFHNGFEGLDYASDHGGIAEGQSFSLVPQNHGQRTDYGHGYGDLDDQTFSLPGFSTNPTFPGNFPFHNSHHMAQSPYAAHSSPNLPQSYRRQGHQATLSAGAYSSSSTGPSTISQTPINSDPDSYFSSSFDQNDPDLSMFANEDFGPLSYGGYHHGA